MTTMFANELDHTAPITTHPVNWRETAKPAHPNRGCRSWGLKPPVSSRLRAM
ncbi:Hypothetical protein PFR_J18_2204 [Propionibacterium freudenreichii]|nr:Hypothetical protein PFR_J18_2204 [Propionibacterium freudenreichii]